MLMIISPAKTFADEKLPSFSEFTQPVFWEKSQELLSILQAYSPADLQKLMGVSEKIADLNVGRFQNFPSELVLDQGAKQAVLSFFGDVYRGLDIGNFSPEDLHFVQDRLRILSGFYGVLRPLDLIAEYRLEMGTPLETKGFKNLYAFWGDQVTAELNKSLEKQKEPVLVNLASNEYFQAIQPEKIQGKIITPVFKEFKNGKYKVVALFAKRARGMMVNFLVKNRIEDFNLIKNFDQDGYTFHPELSRDQEWVFCRESS